MQLGEQNWKDAAGFTDKVVVLPLGSLEQHGHHLPLLTDSMIGSEIVRRTEAELHDQALFLPMLWTGASDHHRAMPGTVSLHNDTYVKVICDILESLIEAGYRRIFLLNAHGGNITPGRMAIYQSHLKFRHYVDLWIAFSSWWTLADEKITSLHDLLNPVVTHACELETSMVLRMRPELVKMDRAAGANIDFNSAFYYPDFSRQSKVDVPRGFDQLSRTGAFGHPEAATAKKGEELIAAASSEAVAFIREFAGWPSSLEPG